MPIDTTPPKDRVLRAHEVRHVYGDIGNSTLWRWVREREIPQPISLGPQAKGWLASEIYADLARRAAARKGAA